MENSNYEANCSKCVRPITLRIYQANSGLCGFCAQEESDREAHERHAELERIDPRPEVARARELERPGRRGPYRRRD